MGANGSGSGVELRKHARSESIRLVFTFAGQRCRETLPLTHTKSNIAYARRLHGEIVNAIARGTFDYETFFPNSRKVVTAFVQQPDRPVPQTVGELLREYLVLAERTLELSSFNCYRDVTRHYLLPRWEHQPIDTLTTRDLRTWIMSLNSKAKTVQLILTPLRNAIELALTDDLIEHNPFAAIRLSKLIPKAQRTSAFKADPFDVDEIEAILAACIDPGDRNMLLFAFTTGMRPSEYIALRWRAIDLKAAQVSVLETSVDGHTKDRAKTPKGTRVIDLRAGAMKALGSQQFGTANALVFLNPRTGEQWAGDKPIYRQWHRILTRAEVRFRNPYQTRHTFASSLLMLGAVPLYVAAQMGHADTTMIFRTYGKWIARGLDGDKRQRLLNLYRQALPGRDDGFRLPGGDLVWLAASPNPAAY